MNKAMIELLEYFPLSMALGNIFFMDQFQDKRNLVPNIIAICITSVNFIFPSTKINEKICPVSEE